MEFLLLGPVEVRTAAGTVAPSAPKIRTVLATLIVDANRSVSTDRLIDEVWGDEPPRTVLTTLHVYLCQLRKLLTPAGDEPVLLTRSSGYLLRADPGDVDADRFEGLAASGRDALLRHDPRLASELLGAALGCWRGPALADVRLGPILEPSAVRLSEARTAALQQRVAADLRLGRHHELIGELQSLTIEHPVREELHGQLMTALYRSGRQVDALRAFDGIRRSLVTDLGIEPGDELGRLRQRIITADPELDWTPPPPVRAGGSSSVPAVRMPVVPAARMPVVPTELVGRDATLDRTLELLRPAPGPVTSPVVVVAGRPGVGKTALAVTAAHRLAGRFPDGQLFLRLRDALDRPFEATEAVVRLLRRAGVAGPDLPADDEDLDDALHGALDGRRMLIVLDDCVSEAQVRRLLPTRPGSAVLITGRRALTGLDGATSLVLDGLSTADSVRLLASLAGPERIARDPGSAQEIVRLCGRLPLAVRVAGARLAAQQHWSAAMLLSRLRDQRSRLAELETGDLAVRATLMTGYAESTDAERSAFRLLGLLPAVDIPLWAAAALIGVPDGDAERLVERLVAGQLLDSGPTGPDGGLRYRFHELLGALAGERLRAEEDEPAVRAATGRLSGAYLAAARSAAAALRGGAGAGAPVRSSLRWFSDQRAALLHVVRLAHGAQLWDVTCALAGALTGWLEVQAEWDDWATVVELALDAAEQVGDRRAEAGLRTSLGDLAWQRSAMDVAADQYDHAVALAGELGDDRSRARSLVRLADVRFGPAGGSRRLDRSGVRVGSARDAERLLGTALPILRRDGDLRGLCDAWRGIAVAQADLGRPGAARDAAGRCLATARQLGDRHWEAYADRRYAETAAPVADDEVEVRPGTWRLS